MSRKIYPAPVERIAGTTIRPFWISSGTAVSSAFSTLYDRSENVVNTAIVVDSGNGHLFAIHQLPNSRSWYVQEWRVHVQGFDYVDRQFIRTSKGEVD